MPNPARPTPPGSRPAPRFFRIFRAAGKEGEYILVCRAVAPIEPFLQMVVSWTVREGQPQIEVVNPFEVLFYVKNGEWDNPSIT